MERKNFNFATVVGAIYLLSFTNGWAMDAINDELREGTKPRKIMKLEHGYQVEKGSDGILVQLRQFMSPSSPSKRSLSPVRNYASSSKVSLPLAREYTSPSKGSLSPDRKNLSPVKLKSSFFERGENSTPIEDALINTLEEYKEFASEVAAQAREGNFLCQEDLYGQYVRQNLDTLSELVLHPELYAISSMILKYKTFGDPKDEKRIGPNPYSIRVLEISPNKEIN